MWGGGTWFLHQAFGARMLVRMRTLACASLACPQGAGTRLEGQAAGNGLSVNSAAPAARRVCRKLCTRVKGG
jgi:hypothetical protein